LSFLSRQTIRRQLVLATLLLLGPLVAAIVYSANRTRLEQEREVGELAASVATTAAAYLDQYFDGVDAVAAAIAQHPSVMALDRDKVEHYLAGLLRRQPIYSNIILTTPDGGVIAAGNRLPAAFDPVPWAYVAEVARSNRALVRDLAISPISGKPVALFAYPVRNDAGGVAGVLGIGIDLVDLQTVFTQIALPEGSVVTLTDGAGRVLATTRDAAKLIGTRIDERALDPADAPLISVRRDPDGVPRVYGNRAVERGPWLLSVGVPRRVVIDRLAPLWRRNIVIVSSAAMFLLVLGGVIAWQTTLHLTRLRSAAQRIAAGDLSAPPRDTSAPNLELHQVQEAFDTMARNLREARDALDRQMEQERKMNEALQSLQRQVVRQERLAAVGLLVSGVAHELNNPLQAILGTAELLERRGELSRDAIDELQLIKTQSGRAREIIRNLSRFGSQQSRPPTTLDLRDVVAEVVQLRRRDLDTAGIALDVNLAASHHVYANFTELEQVILNFVINAQQAIDNAGVRGRIEIRTADAGRRVRLEVSDNGPGVAAADQPKLFQPFFTTKPVGQGTGLGLSVSYGIIDSYGGTIGYAGNEWGGATFFFELPAVQAGGDMADDREAVLRGPV
jgi:C4-dicarboxylate-specific signal transduction histidine kinase